MENTYYFQVTLANGHADFSPPVLSPSYQAALNFLYYQPDSRVVGAELKALKLWGGLLVTKPADLFNPSSYDVDF